MSKYEHTNVIKDTHIWALVWFKKNQTFSFSILVVNMIEKYKLKQFLEEKKMFSIFKMADLEKFKLLAVFGFEHHHFTIFLIFFFPKIFKTILCIQFSLSELGQFTQFLWKVENIKNCKKSANFHLHWAAPFCNFSKKIFIENTSFVLYFHNFTTRGLNNSINFYLESV